MWDLGDTVPLTFTVTDGQGVLVNATTAALAITLPDATTLAPAPTVTNPSTGQYRYDYVPTVSGLHIVRWAATGPAAAFADVVDVRPVGEASVVSLADARAHLNVTIGRTVDDEELRPVLLASVERVERHLGFDLVGQPTASQRLAVLEVLGELWTRSQRARFGGARPTAGYGGQQADDGGGWLPLERRLTDLLGEAVIPTKGAPQGCFPAPLGWPE